MSPRTFLVIGGAALLWASSGAVFGVEALGLVALWAGALLSLLLAVVAWRALAEPVRWVGPVLAALAVTSVGAFALFTLVQQATHHRPLGAATMAALVAIAFAAALIAAVRMKVSPAVGYGLAATAAGLALIGSAASFSWQVWLQLATGAAFLALCVYVQRRDVKAARAKWSTWAIAAILGFNFAFLVLGLPPSVQEAPIVLGLLGVLS